LPSARLPFVRRALLLPAVLALAPVSARAETLPMVPTPRTGVERTRVQRAIADDPVLDRYLAAPTASELRAAAIGQRRALPVPFAPAWPSPGVITTYFGERGPLSPKGHTGLDIAGPEDTPIKAAEGGEVVKAVFSDDGYGGLVIIAHPAGYETWYAHLGRFDVKKGQLVKKGEQIGLMGSTGLSTGTHLHFEVHRGRQLEDPLKFLGGSALQPVKR
jgi:murein DD-endopeptidase MepM/ murein hydrolase activator NlpD